MTSDKLRYQELLAQWVPLALSWVMMSIASPIVNAGISRLPDPALNLAAYGLTTDIAVLVESPIIMILSASVSLIRGRASYRLLTQFTLHLTVLLTLLGVLVYYTPVYDVLFLRVLGLPPAVADAAHPSLQVMLLWPLAIGWRRLYQGILIQRGQTRLVTYGTLFRLATLALVVWVGVTIGALPGALIGGLAMAASVIVEMLVIVVWALPVVRQDVLPVADEGPKLADGRRMSYGAFLRFYLPLATTDTMRVLTRPVTIAGIARAGSSTLSLAAWPPAFGLVMLLSSSVMALQEIVLARLNDDASRRRLALFCLAVGAVFTGLLVLLTFTSLADWYFRTMLRLPPDVEALAIPAARIMAPLPLLFAARNYGRGVLIGRRQSGRVQSAMTLNLMALIVLLTLGGWANGWPGALVAAGATLGAQVIEVFALQRYNRQQPKPSPIPAT